MALSMDEQRILAPRSSSISAKAGAGRSRPGVASFGRPGLGACLRRSPRVRDPGGRAWRSWWSRSCR